MKMQGNPELVVLRKIYCLAAVLILISSFAGCAAGSCLSYGHSCWGAHGKRSGVGRPLENIAAIASGGDVKRLVAAAPPSFGERWLLSRLVNRQLMQVPLAAKLRARMLAEQQQQQQTLPIADEEQELPPNAAGIKHSALMEKLSGDVDVRDMSRNEQRMAEGDSSDILLIPQRKDFSSDDDQAIKIGLYKILKNIDEKLK